MIEFGLIGLFSGLLIGGRYKVFVLVPVELLAVAILAPQGAAAGLSLGHQALAFVTFALCLQAAYAARIAVRGRAPQPSSLAGNQA